MLCTLPEKCNKRPNMPGLQKISYCTAALTAMLLVGLGGCGGSPGDPEAELRAWVNDSEAAAEDRDRRGLVAKVSANYADARGNDREALGNLFRVYMLRQQSISILTKIDDIALHGDSAADVSLTVGMAGTNNHALGLRADAYRFELELEKDDGEWLLIGARWAELGDDLR